MAKEIRVSINTDVTFNATEKEEKLIKAIHEASLDVDDDYEIYDKLMNKLSDLLLSRLYQEIKGLDDIEILDINWE